MEEGSMVSLSYRGFCSLREYTYPQIVIFIRCGFLISLDREYEGFYLPFISFWKSSNKPWKGKD